MCKEPPNDTTAETCLVPASRTFLPLKLLRVFLLVFFLKILGFMVEGLALFTVIDRPHLAKALGTLIGLSPSVTYDLLAPKTARYTNNL